MGQRHILHCDCNCFYASVEMQEHPELRGKSIAVCGDPEARQAAYRALFRDELEPSLVDAIRSATNGNFALGGSRFSEEIARALGRRATRGRPGRPRKQDDELLPELVER